MKKKLESIEQCKTVSRDLSTELDRVIEANNSNIQDNKQEVDSTINEITKRSLLDDFADLSTEPMDYTGGDD